MLRRENARRSIDPRGFETNNCTESSWSPSRWCRENTRRRALEGLISNCTPTRARAKLARLQTGAYRLARTPHAPTWLNADFHGPKIINPRTVVRGSFQANANLTDLLPSHGI